MSEEEYSEEEVEVEEDTEEVSKKLDVTKRSRERMDNISIAADGDENLTEAERALQAVKRRNDDHDDTAKLQDYEERRRAEREREEEELRVLKEKQEQRRLQREEEEREQAERRLAEEERRRQEEEERKAKIEAERKKKEEEKKKRQQVVGTVNFGTPTGGRNFTLPDKKKDQGDKFGNIVQAKQEMGMTKDQKEEAKKSFVAQVMKNMGDLASMGGAELKGKLKEMHQRICKLEAEKYDLEKRLQTQEYDLKELNERQRQINRQKLHLKGIDPNAANSRFPPKVAIFSKYDRQIDRRNFKERKSMYDKKHAHPCFPNVPPPPTILEFKPLPDGPPKSPGAEDDGEEEE